MYDKRKSIAIKQTDKYTVYSIWHLLFTAIIGYTAVDLIEEWNVAARYKFSYRKGLMMFLNTRCSFHILEPFTSHAVPKKSKEVVSKMKVV